MKWIRHFTLLLVLLSFSACYVTRQTIDYNTLPEADKQRLLNQRNNSQVRIQSGWIANPFYWGNGYYGNWNGWNYNQRFYSPGIIIKRQPNKRYDYNRNRNRPRPNNQPNRRNITPRRNDNTNHNIGRSSSGSRPNAIRRASPKSLPQNKRRGNTGGKKNEH